MAKAPTGERGEHIPPTARTKTGASPPGGDGGVPADGEGNIMAQPSLVRFGGIDVLGDPEEATIADPFASFTEWAGAEDDVAFRRL